MANRIVHVGKIEMSKSLTEDAVDRLHAELADSSNFGMAKSILAMGAAAGFDMTSEAGIAQYVSRYNDSINLGNAGDSQSSIAMASDEKRAFNKKRQKQLAKKKKKTKK